ncbi:MAG TPA: oligosaccharide flippase family protein [Chloroflexia bacterium]|nr:oligosaccharide flippase family protein [Chloroflexia bacterium]
MSKNFVILLVAQGWNQLLTALAGLLIIRALLPDEYGNYTLAVVGLNIGLIFSDAGLAGYLNREAARTSPGYSTMLWYKALQLRSGFSIVVGIVLVGLAWQFPALGQPGFVSLAALALLPTGVTALTTASLNGQGRIKSTAFLNT